MGHPIQQLAEVSAEASAKLMSVGVTTTEQLLERAAQAPGRDRLAAQIGVSSEEVLAWANEADLLRVLGTAEGFTPLLEAAGVETVDDLAGNDAELLSARIAEINAELNLVQRVPAQGEVAAWIEAARAR